MTNLTPSFSSSLHLSEEELDAVLMGLGSRAAEAHLAQCQSCSAKIQDFESSISLFNQSSLEWSESRPVPASLETAVHRIQTAPAAPSRFKPVRSIGWACAVVTLLAIGFELGSHQEQRDPQDFGAQSAYSSGPVTEDTESQIAEDNKLLQSVDSALSEDAPSPILDYGLRAISTDDPLPNPALGRKLK